jgi:UDP-glucuronate decarboxylase
MNGKGTLLEDFEIVAHSNLPFDEYRNSTFLITGATGLIGSLLVKNLLYCNKVHGLNLKVLAIIRNIEKAKNIYGDLVNNEVLQFIITDLDEGHLEIDSPVDYIIHAAAVTVSKVMVTNPVVTIKTAFNGTEAVLQLAAEKKSKGVVYISSMEVYGSLDVDHKVSEQDLGFVDLTSVRSCYPEGKRMCECLCTAYSSQYGVNVKSARLAQTFGAGILPTENRVFAQFAKSAMKGEDIVLHTLGKSEGNYVYTRDAVKAILMLLIKGEAGHAYNISNEESHMTIAAMAEMVADKIAYGKIKVVLDVSEDSLKFGYATDVKMHLDSSKMRFLGWKPEVGLLESYQRMMKCM